MLPVMLGLAHAASDGSAGLLIGSLTNLVPADQVLQLVVLYNVIAFGGQPLAGAIADRIRNPRGAALFGVVMTIAALVTFRVQPAFAVALAGVGSAAFHVGAGAIALCATQGRAAGPGLFAAPGVVGLAVGGALAASHHASPAPFILALAILGGVVSFIALPPMPYRPERPDEPMFEGHDYVMLILLAAIAFRSAVWNIFQIIFAGQVASMILLAFAAAVGKALGGVLADRIGLRRWSLGALAVAAPLLSVAGQRLVPLAAGLALLQSATAPMLTLMAQTAPRFPATAAGLTLGLGIGLGGLPFLGFAASNPGPPAVLTITICAGVALAVVFRLERRADST